MNTFDTTAAFKSLRRRILKTLYDFFQDHPYGLLELRSLEETCETDARTLNWNMVYLERCGYVELDKSQDCPPYVSCAASIRPEGIDLVEDALRFDRLFPGGPAPDSA